MPAKQGKPLSGALGHIAQRLPLPAREAQVVMPAHQLFPALPLPRENRPNDDFLQKARMDPLKFHTRRLTHSQEQSSEKNEKTSITTPYLKHWRSPDPPRGSKAGFGMGKGAAPGTGVRPHARVPIERESRCLGRRPLRGLAPMGGDHGSAQPARPPKGIRMSNAPELSRPGLRRGIPHLRSQRPVSLPFEPALLPRGPARGRNGL